jgi:hypothetical protein
MQYMLLIYDDEAQFAGMGDEERNRLMGEYFAYTDELRQAGAFVAGDALQPTPSATSVRLRDGERLVTDGPYAETKEQLGGYYLIDAPNLDDAIEAASKMPNIVTGGSVEVRPIQEFD